MMRRKRRKRKTDPLKYALRLLNVRARSVEEVRKRMRMKGYGEEEIENVLRKLEDMDMLNDVKFSNLYAYDRMVVHKKGPKLIRMELIELGVEEKIVEETISKLLEEVKEEDIIRDIVRKWDNLDRKKMIDRLLRRGFDYQKVVDVLNSFFEKENQEN